MYHAKNCYVKIDNTEMEYVTFGNGTQPFIIIPGLGDALKTVRGTAVPFSYMYRTYAKYFKVYLFSRKNMIPKDYTIADMADDQAKVLKTLGISDACVMGVSQGGMISMHLAAKYPELVTKLVLVNTAPYANDVIKTVVGTWIDMAKQGDFKDIFIDTAEKTYSEQKLKTYRRFYGILSKMSEPRRLERFIIQGNACMAHDARPWLGKIQVPTLIVGGERDYIVGNKAAYELAENISDCKLKIYEKYGHGAFEEAKDFNDLVLKFLV